MTAALGTVVLFWILWPAAAGWVARRVTAVRAVGPVVLCYVAGIVAGNLLSSLAPTFYAEVEPLALSVSEGTIVLAIPLLLFRTDLRAWLSQARSALVAFIGCVVGVLAAATAGFFLFGSMVDEAPAVAGMMVGVYTGGTPNMSAISIALRTRPETFIVINAADVLVSAIYFLVLTTILKPVLRRFLPAHSGEAPATASTGDAEPAKPAGARLGQLAVSVLIAAAIVAASIGAVAVLFGSLDPLPVILGVSTLAVAAALLPAVRRLTPAYAAGEYLMLVFCVALGTLASYRALLDASVPVVGLVAFTVAVAVTIQFAIAAAFRIDVDTTLITSTAAIFGPPFVAPVASALGNPRVVITGVTSGLIGYAVGTYLGVLLAGVLS